MRILLVDDNAVSLETLRLLARDLGYDAETVTSPLQAIALLDDTYYPLIITDIQMPDMNGLDLLTAIKSHPMAATSDVVLFTGNGDMQSAVEAMRRGAYDYLAKPVDVRELAAVIKRSAEHQALLHENRELRRDLELKVAEATRDIAKSLEEARHKLREVTGIGQMVAQSDQMRRLVDEALIMHGNPSVPVLIEGETGTGKEVLARLIHHGNGTSPEPFIGINCAAIPAELFESELFGHEPGAFTGSRTGGAQGKLEAAGNGTVFLDEVAELPLALQPKLLRALEEKAFYRLGGVKRREFQARVVCAANRDLDDMVEKGLFRRDLYHRLRVGHLRLPPLRERGEDLIILAELILRRESERKKKDFKGFSPEALAILRKYPWPGNVRELENTIERAVLMHEGEVLTPLHLNFLTLAAWAAQGDPGKQPQTLSQPGGDWLSQIHTGRFVLPEQPFDLEDLIDNIVQAAVARFDGNKTRAANFLGISRFALHRRLQNIRSEEGS